MRRVLLTLAALALLGLIGGTAVVGLGLYNVSARAGHLPGVKWVLHTTFRQSVKLRAPPASEVPDLDDPALAELGARHYQSACSPCHATPGTGRSAAVRHMNPEPPHIETAVAQWEPRHLFWIVREGVKMSGMPAWPAPNRDDEIWAVVAYLERVKQGLTDDAQVALIEPMDLGGPPEAAYCAGCHEQIRTSVPRLDILSSDYIQHALSEYRSGARPSGIMAQAASVVDPELLRALADYFSAAEPAGSGRPRGPLEEKGRLLAQRGTREVPACRACHGPGAPRRSGLFPDLAGQDRAYLERQLGLWKSGLRDGSELMRAASRGLTPQDIEALAAYYAALPPGPVAEIAE